MKIWNFCLIVSAFGILFAHGDDVTIQINHWNDISAQLDPFEPLKDSTDVPKGCSPIVPNKTCDGGFAYLIKKINEPYIGIPASNVLKLTSGNLVGGESGWLSMIFDGWKQFGQLVNQHYKPNVMSLGIKEFGAGLEQTFTYVNNTDKAFTKTLLSNVKNCDLAGKDTAEEKVCNLTAKYTVVNVISNSRAGVEIGIVGFVNPNVVKLGAPGSLEFEEIVTGLKGPIDILTKSGIKFIIALGDGSLDTAKSIIDAYSNVKVVVYGRGFGASKNMAGVYPESYKGSYIGTAGKYGVSMGKMIIKFDSTNGNIISTANSILVPINNNGEHDSPAQNAVEDMRTEVANKNEILGKTHVTIHGGDVCWTKECNLGNIMADAAVHCAYQIDGMNYNIPEGPLLGIWHGGALFYDIIQKKNNISALDVHKWLPYHNNVHLVAIKGSSLKLLFKASATALDVGTSREPKWGQFLQISNGMEVTYSTSGGQGHLDRIRVIKESDSAIPEMAEIEDDERFLLAMPSFIREGRSIFDFIKNDTNFFLPIPTTENGYYRVGFDDNCLRDYILANKGLVTGFEERIFIDVSNTPGHSKCNSNTTKHVLLTLFITLLILGGVFVGWKFLWPRFNNVGRSRFP